MKRACGVITTAVLFLSCLMCNAQTITGSLSGSVMDAMNGMVIGAQVSVTNNSTGQVIQTTTNKQGQFDLPSLLPSSYSVVVEQQGFKTYEMLDVNVTANASFSVGVITLEVGAVSQKIEVHAEGALLETESAARGTAIVGKQIENVEVNGRSFLSLMRTVPGFYGDGDFSTASNQTGNIYVNGSRGTQFNITLNGASNLDTGNNSKMFATVGLESVQEFRVLTSNYQAEYGKAAGAQISVVTKSGGKDFHGGGYWYYRDKGMNADNWYSKRSGQPRANYHFNYEGYYIGGPVFIPGKFNTKRDKLFFFWSDEYQQQLIPESLHQVTVPTALERQGDFSQSVDKNGASVAIKDYTTGAAFPGNKIPLGQQYAPGIALLNLFPLPNVTGSKGYNYQSQVSSSEPRHEGLLRMDYNATQKLRFYGSLAKLFSDALTGVYCPSTYSLCPNFPLAPIQYKHPGYVLALNATATLSSTLVNETLFDIGHHPVTVMPTDPSAFTQAKTGVALATLYAPYQNWIPNVAFGGTKIGNSPNFNTGGGAWTPFTTSNSTIEFIDNLSKLVRSHSLKMGVYIQHAAKDQTAYALTGGSYNFGDSTTNTYDTGFGFANAAIGTFASFQQANKPVNGQYRYTNAEFYAQDTWRINSRLVADIGLRGYYIQPQYDRGFLASNFLPSVYSTSQAVRLYYPAFNGSGTKSGYDATTNQYVSSSLIGDIVPNSGTVTNGILQSQRGINKYLMNSPGILWAPRVGFTFDPTGHQNMVLRAGAGLFYDRYQGNEIFNLIANPPAVEQPTVYNSLAQNLSATAALLAPVGLTAIDTNGKVPRTASYSGGIQAKLPLAIVVDASYVGSTSRNLIQGVNLNPVAYGATFLQQNQDPTKVTATPNASLGSNSYDANFLRQYKGYGDITLEHFGGTSNYNSFQLTVNRRFATGLFLGASYVYSKCLDTGSGDGAGVRIDNLTRTALYGPCDFNIPQNFTFNYVYPLPLQMLAFRADNVLTRAALKGWQVSGITIFRNGTPYSPGFSVPNYGSTQITGSQTQSSRVKLVGDPRAGITSSPYGRINAAAFAPPAIGSIGIDSPRNYMVGPGVNNFDMTLQKDTPLKDNMKLQVRMDAFNVANHTQFSGINSTINFAGITNATPTNLAGPTNLTGFGSVSGARSPRILQLVMRIVF